VREVKRLKEEPKEITILSREREKELLNELRAKYAKAIVLVAVSTCMRSKEILDLAKDSADFKKG